MLVGPPGCGKTMLVQAAAKETNGLLRLEDVGSSFHSPHSTAKTSKKIQDLRLQRIWQNLTWKKFFHKASADGPGVCSRDVLGLFATLASHSFTCFILFLIDVACWHDTLPFLSRVRRGSYPSKGQSYFPSTLENQKPACGRHAAAAQMKWRSWKRFPHRDPAKLSLMVLVSEKQCVVSEFKSGY